jgi:glyoxylase-like metal-dependent hydrolase (beta-lactamase superfamily II)
MTDEADPQDGMQMPKPLSRQIIGEFRVTLLSDGYFDLPRSFFVSPSGDAPQQPQDGNFRLEVNAFLIEGHGRKILVDTGCGTRFGPTVNQIGSSLLAAGVVPSDIDTILCTHIHSDHVMGLIDADGAARFPNAEILVHEDEFAYWMDDTNMQRAPEAQRHQFVWARDAFAPYLDRLTPFQKGEVIHGIEAIPLFGHTPGHCGYQIDGGGNQQLIIWGDCVHSIRMQARNPEIAFSFDVDQNAAREIRRKIFDRAAVDDVLVTGMHVDHPAFIRLRRRGNQFDYAFEHGAEDEAAYE